MPRRSFSVVSSTGSHTRQGSAGVLSHRRTGRRSPPWINGSLWRVRPNTYLSVTSACPSRDQARSHDRRGSGLSPPRRRCGGQVRVRALRLGASIPPALRPSSNRATDRFKGASLQPCAVLTVDVTLQSSTTGGADRRARARRRDDHGRHCALRGESMPEPTRHQRDVGLGRRLGELIKVTQVVPAVSARFAVVGSACGASARRDAGAPSSVTPPWCISSRSPILIHVSHAFAIPRVKDIAVPAWSRRTPRPSAFAPRTTSRPTALDALASGLHSSSRSRWRQPS